MSSVRRRREKDAQVRSGHADDQIAKTGLPTPKRTLRSASRWEDNGDRDGRARRQRTMYECMSSYRCVQRVGRAESQTPPPSVRSSGSSRLPLIHHAPLCSCVAELARSRIAKARGNHACQLVCRVSDAQGLCPMHNCAESLRQAAQRRSGRQAGRQCHGDRVTAAHWRACRRRLQWSHAPSGDL